jgi:hypothetical protein
MAAAAGAAWLKAPANATEGEGGCTGAAEHAASKTVAASDAGRIARSHQGVRRYFITVLESPVSLIDIY